MPGKQLFCRTCEANGVKVEIFFSPSVKSASGKMIPIEVESKKNHSCPFRQQNQTVKADSAPAPIPEAKLNERILLDAINGLKAQLNRIEQALAVASLAKVTNDEQPSE